MRLLRLDREESAWPHFITVSLSAEDMVIVCPALVCLGWAVLFGRPSLLVLVSKDFLETDPNAKPN